MQGILHKSMALHTKCLPMGYKIELPLLKRVSERGISYALHYWLVITIAIVVPVAIFIIRNKE